MASRKFNNRTNWEAAERSGLRPTVSGDIIENLLRVPLNPRNRKDGHFDLYYFLQSPEGGRAKKTVLFCAGGPGEIVRGSNPNETFAGFLSANEYNVVFFHLRGAGFSQIPPATRFDKFLRTSYAVRDVEAIRRALLGTDGQWDGIIAWSYGTVLAQQYAHFHPNRVRKLILLAPLSRHMFKKSANAFDDLNDGIRSIHRQTLEKIYSSKEFEDDFGLLDAEKKQIIEKLFGSRNDPTEKGIFQTTEDAFGSIQFVINNFFELRQRGELRKYGLDKYGRDFFRKLRDLRRVGSSTVAKGTTEKRIAIGQELRDEILDRKKAEDEQPDDLIQDSDRVFYVIGARDGINLRFLKELPVAGREGIRFALRKSGGDANVERGVNKFLEKVRINDGKQITPWDPATYSHSVPTLILKGEADPVTTDGQAEYMFLEALKGPRTFMEFPGIGHDFSLPLVEEEDDNPILSGVIRFDPDGILPAEIRAVNGTISGRRLNAKLRMDLKPPEDFNTVVEVAAVALLVDGKLGDADQTTKNIIALIKNTSRKAIRLNLENSYWPISCHFFAGSVQFSSSTGAGALRLSPGEVQALFGTVIYGGRNEQRLYRLEPEDKIDDSLELLGFNVEEINVLHVWIRSRKRITDLTTRKWTISRDDFKKTFRITLPSVEEGQVVEIIQRIDGLHQDNDEELVVRMTPGSEDRITAYIPQEPTSDTISVILSNEGDEPFNGRPGTWLIDNAFFSVNVSVDPPSVPPKLGIKTSGTIKGLRWKKSLEIAKPDDLDSELELVGFNILSDETISLLLKNNGRQIVRGGTREWVYIDPLENKTADPTSSKEKSKTVSLRMRTPLLNRMIYSFMVMDTKNFSNEKINTSLKVMREAFKGDSVLFKIKYLEPEKIRGGREAAGERGLSELDNVRAISISHRKNLPKGGVL